MTGYPLEFKNKFSHYTQLKTHCVILCYSEVDMNLYLRSSVTRDADISLAGLRPLNFFGTASEYFDISMSVSTLMRHIIYILHKIFCSEINTVLKCETFLYSSYFFFTFIKLICSIIIALWRLFYGNVIFKRW